MLSSEEEELLRERLQNAICRFCVEHTQDGRCHLTTMPQCPIPAHIPQLVRLVERVHSGHISDYLALVRREICDPCSRSYTAEDCPTRTEGHCVLDAYLLPIVEEVEQFLQEIGRLPQTPGGG